MQPRVHRHIRAPRERVFRLLPDPAAVAEWRVPYGMTARVHAWEAREGGAVRVSLAHDAPAGTGKTAGRTDTYHGRFVRIVPNETVVEADRWGTSDPSTAGEMVSTIPPADTADGVGVHENPPPGVRPEDNETGWRMALDRLAALAGDDPAEG